MSASAYFGGGIVMQVSFLVAFRSAISPTMPHEPMLVIVFFGSIIGIIAAIIFFNEIKFGFTGRSLFG